VLTGHVIPAMPSGLHRCRQTQTQTQRRSLPVCEVSLERQQTLMSVSGVVSLVTVTNFLGRLKDCRCALGNAGEQFRFLGSFKGAVNETFLAYVYGEEPFKLRRSGLI
jgi:hypothetical protein